VGAYIHRFHLSVDYALAISYRRNAYDGKAKFVARVTLVKGVPFYGFHVGYRYYLKLYMLNPMVMTRLADILRQGAVMKQVFQPYEAHLQYLLQWMADYNLYGCGYIDCRKVVFRSPVPEFEDLDNSTHLWHDRSIPSEFVSSESELKKVSHCSLEVDICVQDILNRHDVRSRSLHHDFIERLNPLAPDEKLVHSMAGLWRDETRRRKAKISNQDPGSSPFPPEVMISMSADPRNSQPGGWIHEQEYREKVMDLIAEERHKSNGAKLSYGTFVKQEPFGSSVKTSLESVEDLYPENLRVALGLTPGKGDGVSDCHLHDDGETEVDENTILRLTDYVEDDQTLYESDEDLMREIKLSQRIMGDQIEGKHLHPGASDNHKDFSDGNYPIHKQEDLPQSLDHVDLSQEDPSTLSRQHNTTIWTEVADFSLRGSGSNEDLYEDSSQSKPSRSKRSDSPIISGSPSSKRRMLSFRQGENIKSNKHSTDALGATPAVYSTTNEKKGGHSNKPKSEGRSPPMEHAKKLVSSSSKSKFYGSSNSQRLETSQDALRGVEKSQDPFLKFPVVKDPHDPNTILRLSQKSPSQLDSYGKKKTVSFGPLLSIAQGTSTLKSSATEPACSSLSTLIPVMINNMRKDFEIPSKEPILVIGEPAPSIGYVCSTMQDFNLPSKIYQDAFFSNEMDVPDRVREWAGREFKLESLSVPFLSSFDLHGKSDASLGKKPGIIPDRVHEEKAYKQQRRSCTLKSWEIENPPPTYDEVATWACDEENKLQKQTKFLAKTSLRASPRAKERLSQVDGPTQKNKHGFKYAQNKTTSVKHEVQYMSTMSLEVHVNTRGTFVPNPEEDEVQCVFWCLQSDELGHGLSSDSDDTHTGIVVVSENGEMSKSIGRQVSIEVQEESSELDLIIRMVEIVRSHDPDILTGYEVHGGSWGYLIERARLKYEYNLCDEFSRMKTQSHGRFGKDNDKWGFNNTSTIRVTGRHMINIWRAMRSELNLLQYTMENVVFHLLHRRVPHYTWADMTKWYTNQKPRDLAKVINYYITRVQLDLEILEQNELIARTSEQARLLGVDFFSVFSRGSQFKVESLMFRIAKPENFLLVSPSRKQVGGQNALECLPLVMEPQSAFYNSPLLVLDFQSLYPSVMIAYNYCYSTFLGRVVNWRGTNKMGFTEFNRQKRLLELLKDHINIAPNGMMYTRPEIRKSLLAKMLGEILETRVMVKSGMKVDKDDISLQRLLNNRQLALKLIANVTYGYTSASFSGRMPCSEIADSIVQTGRETLEKAIALIHSVKRWGAEVVYGDTDSIFVYLKGRTKDEAFDIGEEIAKTVTNMNPRPIKLKFEKVYLPCVLLAKKRYVGFKYESREQTEPDFDAKGIETVRRDGTPAEQKIEEKALKILFRTADLSEVKSYFQKQCEKIMKGSVSIQDFCFAREVKLGTYSDKGLPPPGALISTKRMLEDARAEPQYGERVPYVVVTGAPGARLLDRCVAPEELLENDHIELDAEYYITKNLIPPLERIFNLVGANVRGWYDEMPKVQRIRRVDANLQLQGQSRELGISKKTLESYMKSSSCLVCKEKLDLEGPICETCLADKPASLLALRSRLNGVEKKFMDLQRVCQSCSGASPLDEVRCDSKDCPVFYTRTRQKGHLKTERGLVEPVMKELSGLIIDMSDLEW
jgi:DNA polymerase zeta